MPDDGLPAIQISRSLRHSAAMRLVTGKGQQRQRAAQQLLDQAGSFGIDLDLLWATIGDDPKPWCRQVCLAVPASGRTAMLFVSGPGASASETQRLGSRRIQERERIVAVQAALRGLERARPGAVRLAQALPEPDETWGVSAFAGAGMKRIGDLAYLRRAVHPGRPPKSPGRTPGPDDGWPDGVRVCALDTLESATRERVLSEALESSYAGTLDCPELCGMRETEDVIASHRSTGDFNPGLWWIVLLDDEPRGCVLLSVCPDHASVELVYVGLAPALRGCGLGRRLLERSLSALDDRRVREITCAVDRRNAPALALYDALGFQEFTSRIAFVYAVG